MKTTNVIILVGVLGVGGVGAYMYMKNKQAQNALLTGSLPATNQGGATTSGTTTSGTTTLSTTSDGVSPNDANLNLANATILAVELSNKKKGVKGAWDTTITENQIKYLESRLAKFGYKLLEKPDPSNPVVRNAFTYELVKL